MKVNINIETNVAEIGTLIDELAMNINTASEFKKRMAKKEKENEIENGFKTEFTADFGNVSEFLANIMGGNHDD